MSAAAAPHNALREILRAPEAEQRFRRINGSRDLAELALAIERDLARTTTPSPTEEAGAAQRRAPVVPFALGKRGRR